MPAIDVLVNNAAIMACDYGRTEDGIEQQFDVGHIGPFLFTNLIMKKIMAAKAPRLVMYRAMDTESLQSAGQTLGSR